MYQIVEKPTKLGTVLLSKESQLVVSGGIGDAFLKIESTGPATWVIAFAVLSGVLLIANAKAIRIT